MQEQKQIAEEEALPSYSGVYRARIAFVTFVLTLLGFLIVMKMSFMGSAFFGGIGATIAWMYGAEMLEPLTVALEEGKKLKARKILPPAKQLPKEEVTEEERPGEKSVTTTTRKFDEEEILPYRPLVKASIPHKNLIDLADNVQIDKSDLAGKAIFVCGIRRHGKTTLGARIAEQLGKHYIPLFIPCLEGDYLSLADVLPRAIVAGHSSVDKQYANYDFISLDTAQEAYELGHTILKLGYQAILDMASYTILDQAIAMQINIIRGMFHWANSNPNDRVPAHVFLDEAQRYLPQTLSDSVILDKTALQELLRIYMDIIAIGGKRGIAPVILTQRFAQVNKKIMAQSEVFFLMRQTNDGDLDRCMEYVNSDIATKEQIAKFQPGQGVYIASDGSQLVTHFKQRESSGKRSSTPQADNARRYATMPLILDEVPSLSKKSNKTAMLPEVEEIRVNPVQHIEAPAKQGTAKLTPELQMVLNVYKPGMTYRDLGEALGVGKDKAGELLKELKRHRAI